MSDTTLKLREHDAEAEIRHELAFLASLTCEERVRLVLDRSRLLLEMMAQSGHPIVPGIAKRA